VFQDFFAILQIFLGFIRVIRGLMHDLGLFAILKMFLEFIRVIGG